MVRRNTLLPHNCVPCTLPASVRALPCDRRRDRQRWTSRERLRQATSLGGGDADGLGQRTGVEELGWAQGNTSVAAKIFRTANAPRTAPDATETLVAQALLDLENNVPDLKAELRPLQISAAREVDVKGGKKAIVVFVPVPQVKAFHKIQGRLTRELEKKFSDRHVVFIGQRRMMRKPTRGSRVKQQRPRSRTLKEVHEKILEDLVFPTHPSPPIRPEITGKRTRQAVDGSKLIKVFLDQKDATNLEYKLDSFSGVYKKLTGKDVHFEFSEQ
ncbi:ribosomal protein S7A [Rhodosporidiobolus nylandii]